MKFTNHINLSKNELQNAVIQNLVSAPSNPKAGQVYFNSTDNKYYVYNGSNWMDCTNQGEIYSFSGGLTKDGNNNVTIDNTVTSATHTKVSYNNKGLITGGSDLIASDIPDLSATYIATTQKGATNGVASLGSDGKVPNSQLPSFVDDVVDSYIVGSTALASDWLSETEGGSALTPEKGKIYVVLTSGAYQNKTYRWSGTTYVEISASPAQATDTQAGIMKLYTSTGSNTDGTMTQKSITDTLSSYVEKITATNIALTSTGGICTWTISHTLGEDVICNIKELSTGSEVYTDITYNENSVTIKINSSTDITADTYKAIIIG